MPALVHSSYGGIGETLQKKIAFRKPTLICGSSADLAGLTATAEDLPQRIPAKSSSGKTNSNIYQVNPLTDRKKINNNEKQKRGNRKASYDGKGDVTDSSVGKAHWEICESKGVWKRKEGWGLQCRWGGVEDVMWNQGGREGWKWHEGDLWMGGQRETGKAGIV